MSFLKNLFSSPKEYYPDAEVLLEEESPLCPILARVEQDNRVAYFYLCGKEGSDFGFKSCWIRNLQKAPEKVEKSLMKKGIPPMLPRQFCQFPDGQEKLNKDHLRIVWMEEGDAAALYYKGEIVAIIPGWSGFGGFFGYARDCQGTGNFAWEITPTNDYLNRVRNSIDFWNSWEDEPNPFQIQQPSILKEYEETFGEQNKYFAIDGNKWPPIGLFLRKGPSKIIFATVCLSLIPMPVVEMHYKNRFEVNRIEIGMILESGFTDQELKEMAEWISGQVAIPWNNITFLGEGHTINFKPFNSTKFDSVVLTNQLDVLPKPHLDNYRNSKINFLYMIPISTREKNEIMKNGSKGIIAKLNDIGEKVFSLAREEVI